MIDDVEGFGQLGKEIISIGIKGEVLSRRIPRSL
jgi:hypothetical protein